MALFLQTQIFTGFHKGSIHGGVLCSHASAPGNNYNIVALFQSGGVEPVYLTQTAAHTVADNCMAQLCGYGITQTVLTCAVAAAIDNQIRGDSTLSLGVQSPEITVLF